MLDKKMTLTLNYIEQLRSTKKLDFIDTITLLRALDISRTQTYDIVKTIDFIIKNNDKINNPSLTVLKISKAYEHTNRKKATIREWLKIRGFKQVDLARALGKQKYQISRYLSDGVSSYDTIKKIAEFLEVDTEQLILK